MSWLSTMFGGGGGSSEADDARKAEEKRQADIRAGTQRINNIFSGGFTPGGQLGAGTGYDPNATYYDANGNVFKPTATPGTPGTAGTPGTVARNANGSVIVPGMTVGGESFTAPRRGSQKDIIVPQGMVASGGGSGQSRNNAATAGTAGTPGTPGKSAQQAFTEALNGGKVYGAGTTDPGAFTEDFFNKRRQAYIDYATPQLQDQYGDAGKELTFSLARSGLLDSTVKGEQGADLKKLFDINTQKVADDALSYETEARTNVEDARQNLIAMLNSTGDVQGAVNSAITRSQALSKPPSFNPLTQVFADFTNTLGAQAAQEQAAAASGGMYKSRYNTNLFSPSGSVKVS